MQTIEQLQAENAQLKTDLKIVKTVMLDITDKLGVTTNGSINEDVEVGDIVQNIMPDLMKVVTGGGIIGKVKNMLGKEEKPNPLVEKFKSVLQLAPLFEKYKNL
jgi:hypothetical protein